MYLYVEVGQWTLQYHQTELGHQIYKYNIRAHTSLGSTCDEQIHTCTAHTYIHTYVCMQNAYEKPSTTLLILHPVFTNPVNQVESVLVQPPGVLGWVTADGLKQLILILTIEGTL